MEISSIPINIPTEEPTPFLCASSGISTGFSIPREKIATAFEPIADKFSMDFRMEFSDSVHRMAIFVSQYDHCLYDLILRNREGETHADIRCVIGNHPEMENIAPYL
jgi:formyltetrahydrofolate deformylase